MLPRVDALQFAEVSSSVLLWFKPKYAKYLQSQHMCYVVGPRVGKTLNTPQAHRALECTYDDHTLI